MGVKIMSCNSATKQIELVRGITYDATVRWEDNEFSYKAISGITKAAPVSITCEAHGVPPGWRVAIASVKGMTQINTLNTPPKESDFHKASITNVNTIALNDVNAAEYSTYVSGGYVQFYTPVDLTGFTAKMQIRSSLEATDFIDEFTTEDTRLAAGTGIVLDNDNKTITINIAASVTEDYEFLNGVYSLEMISPTGVVTRILSGDVVCSNDVTR